MNQDRLGSPVAAVVFDRGVDVDAVLGAAIGALRQEGVAVVGLLQSFGERLASGKRSMWLEDLGSGQRRRIDQPRGPGATGCTLDADALASAACDLRRALRAGGDLLVINRFGGSEASGGGLRAEITEALLGDTPLLIAVREDLLEAWESFLGAPAFRLPPQPEALLGWAEDMLAPAS